MPHTVTGGEWGPAHDDSLGMTFPLARLSKNPHPVCGAPVIEYSRFCYKEAPDQGPEQRVSFLLQHPTIPRPASNLIAIPHYFPSEPTGPGEVRDWTHATPSLPLTVRGGSAIVLGRPQGF